MAEFYLVLKKAVGGLHPNTTETRRGVYEKARNALIAQLKGINPPLSNAEISRRRLEMEEAIRRVERENAEALQATFPGSDTAALAEPQQPRAADTDWPPPSPPLTREPDWAPRRYAGDPPPRYPSRTPEYADVGPARLARREPFPDRSEPPPMGRSGPDDFDGDRRGPQAFEWASGERRDFDYREPDRSPPPRRRVAVDPEPRRSAAPIADADEYAGRGKPKRRGTARPEAEPRAPRKSRLPSLILLVLFLSLIGLVGFVALQNREAVARVIKDPRQIVSVIRDIVSASGPARPPSPAPPVAGKTDTQVAQASGVRQILAGERELPPAEAPIAAPVTPVPDPPPAPVLPTTPLPPPVTQKVTFIEESTTNPGQISATLTGSVVWSVSEGADGTAVLAKITVPDRKLELSMLFHKNNDTTASHQVDINVSLGVGSSIGSVDLIPTIVFKANDKDAGSRLAGRSIKIVEACSSPTAAAPKCRDVNNKPAAAAPGVYWVALSPAKPDVAANIALLREKPLIDLPIAYKSGQRAIITIEKGAAATAMFNRALLAWGN
ncbi:MAG: hypothetical protein U1E56_10830 [Bauldia sp.]